MVQSKLQSLSTASWSDVPQPQDSLLLQCYEECDATGASHQLPSIGTARLPGQVLCMVCTAQAGTGDMACTEACLNRLPRLCCHRLGVQHLPLHGPAPPKGSSLRLHEVV